MRLLVLSDIHERVNKINKLRNTLFEKGFEPSVVVIAGDLTYFKDLETARKVLLEVKRVFGTKVLFVPGNCDPPDLLEVRELDGDLLNIHARVVKVEDYVFYGVGGGGISPFNTVIEYTEDQFREFMEALENAGLLNNLLIVVTHQPIHGFFDDVRGERIGSRVFAEYLEKLQPLLWVTGHVHENSGWAKAGRTTLIHPGPFMRGYYATVSIEGDAVVAVDVGKIHS